MMMKIALISWMIGGLTAYLASRRGRQPMIWFLVGMGLGAIGLCLLFLIPNKKVDVLQTEVKVDKDADASVVDHSIPPRFRWSKVEWYYLDENRKQKGAISFSSLLSFWSQGQIKSDTYIWSNGMKKWRKIREIPGMSDAFDTADQLIVL